MGLSKKKTKTETKPHFYNEISGAGKDVSAAYQNSRGTVNDIAGGFKGLYDDLLDGYREGDPNLDAARSYNLDVLSGDGTNPYLEDIIEQTNNNVLNRKQAILGKRGFGGTSNFGSIIARDLAENESGLRYNDYEKQQGRKERAASMAPGLAASDLIRIAPLLSVGEQAAMLPMRHASGYGATIGGLLGPYTNSTQTSSGGFLPGLIGTALSGWAGGGFRT